MAQPSWFVTLTAAPRNWPEVQRRMAAFGRCLRRQGDAAYVYVAEPNPGADDLAHVHLWLRGREPRGLAELAVRADFGEVADARPFGPGHGHRRPTVDYGLKSILRGRPTAPEALWPSAVEHLELNGNRLVHATRGFWHDWQGRPVEGGLRKARYLAHRTTLRQWRGATHRAP